MSVKIDDLLRDLVGKDASDLHLKAGQPPIMRIHGELVRSNYPALSAAEAEALLTSVLSEERKKRLYEEKELDLSYYVEGVARFRVNMFWQRHKLGAVFRVIPYKIRTIDELRMPQVCKKLALLPRGLILVTGPTGSGKSTSLAAMIHHINQTQRCHVMTIEDPIEYVHIDQLSVINQRELGTDTYAFKEALKHVMRQNPDTILVGEMRDLETIMLAITAAETGHLVFSTLHTVDAAQTIDRIVDVFSPDQQEQIRTQISVTLQGILSQSLIPTRDGKGRVAAFEALVATPSVRMLIREGKTFQIPSIMQVGKAHGMVSLNDALMDLVTKKLVAPDEAYSKAVDKPGFEGLLKRAGINTSFATAGS